VPWSAVEFLAEQLGIDDAPCVKKYVQRPQTPYEHAWRSATGTGTGPPTIRPPATGSRGSSTVGRGRTLRGRWRCSSTQTILRRSVLYLAGHDRMSAVEVRLVSHGIMVRLSRAIGHVGLVTAGRG
jgi:hypothetical protein